MSSVVHDLSASWAARLRGSSALELVTPDDPGFDAARATWNTVHEHHPVAVAFPFSAVGVIEVVDVARELGLSVAIQATGHGPTRAADGAILVNLARMTDVQVDPARRTAVIGGGAKWGSVLDVVTPHGLAPLLGSSPDVGAVGYTLGGGIGWLVRKYGTAADSVRAIEIVTGDGRLVRATAEEEPELFWALRGAGAGHLGVVTSMEITLYPISQLYAGNLLYPAELASEVLARWRAWLPDLPVAMTAAVALMNFPPLDDVPPPLRGKSFTIVRGAYDGPDAEGEQLLAYWRDWRAPEMDAFGPLPFSRVAEISQDPLDPIPNQATGLWLRSLSDASIEALIGSTFVSGGPPLILFSQLVHTTRSVSPADSSLSDDTARDASMLLEAIAVTPTPEAVAAARAAFDRLKEAIDGDLTGRLYLNFVEGDERRLGVGGAVSPEARQRLAAVKARYDPERNFDHGLDVSL